MTYELSDSKNIDEFALNIGADALPDRRDEEHNKGQESYTSNREVETLFEVTKATAVLDHENDLSEESSKVEDEARAREFDESFDFEQSSDLQSEEEFVPSGRAIINSFDLSRSVEGLPPFSSIVKEKRDVLSGSLKVVCEKLNAQVAAIFLTDKDGLLARASIFGVDRNGELIDPSWYEEEAYAVDDKSLVGITATTEPNSKFGRIRYSNNLQEEDAVDSPSRERYLEKFGFLGRAIAVPINGRNRTYGVLRILNFVDPETKQISGPAIVTKEDAMWLSLLATHISSALANFRRDLQSSIITQLHDKIANPLGAARSYQDALYDYQEAVDLLVDNPETAFKAGVLRLVEDSTQRLKVVVSSCVTKSAVERDNRPIEIGDHLVAGSVSKKKERLIISDLASTKLRNKEWVESNGFKTLCCLPLVSRGKLFGTLSLYTSYQYDYHEDSLNFLESIAKSIATYTLIEFSDDPTRLIEMLNVCERSSASVERHEEERHQEPSATKERDIYRLALPRAADTEERRLFYEEIDDFRNRHSDWLVLVDELRPGEETALILIQKEDPRLPRIAARSIKSSLLANFKELAR